MICAPHKPHCFTNRNMSIIIIIIIESIPIVIIILFGAPHVSPYTKYFFLINILKNYYQVKFLIKLNIFWPVTRVDG